MHVSAKEIQAAGGLEKWTAMANRKLNRETSMEELVKKKQYPRRSTIVERHAANKAKAIPLEHEEQTALIAAWDNDICTRYDLPKSLLFAVPNGGKRHPSVAKKLKAEGVRAGIPDLILACPSGKYKALFVEMKRVSRGAVTEAQKNVHFALRLRGYAVAVCKGKDMAIQTIVDYLDGKYCEPVTGGGKHG